MVLGAFVYANDNDDKLPGSWKGSGAVSDTFSDWGTTPRSIIAYWWGSGKTSNWMYQVYESGIDKNVFVCPSKYLGTHSEPLFCNANYAVGYSTPATFWTMSIAAAKRPSEQVIVLDSDRMMSYYMCIPAPGLISSSMDFSMAKSHSGRWNIGCIDGHAESVNYSELSNTDTDIFTNN